MKKLNYQVIINNEQQFIFENLFALKYYDMWSQAFSETTIIKGGFSLNSDIEFLDKNGYGVGGFIQKNDGKSILKIVYTYEVADSIRKELVDHNNDYYELYKLSKNDDGFIVLDVELAILDEYAEMMDTMWKEAVVLIKSTYDKI